MPTWTEELANAWESRRGPVAFATTSSDGLPNVVYVTWVQRYEDAFLLADNYFDKTRANIESGSRDALVFLTSQGRSYQVKGALERQTEGPAFDNMKTWLQDPKKHPGHAAVLLLVEEAYSNCYGSKRIQ